MAEPPIGFQSDAYQGLDDDAGGAKHGSTVSRRVGCWRGRARRRRAGSTHAEIILFTDTGKTFSAERNAHLNEPTTTAYHGNALMASGTTRQTGGSTLKLGLLNSTQQTGPEILVSWRQTAPRQQRHMSDGKATTPPHDAPCR